MPSVSPGKNLHDSTTVVRTFAGSELQRVMAYTTSPTTREYGRAAGAMAPVSG